MTSTAAVLDGRIAVETDLRVKRLHRFQRLSAPLRAELQLLVCAAADIRCRSSVEYQLDRRPDYTVFRCCGCGSEWVPFDTGTHFAGCTLTAEELKGPDPSWRWWRCPRGCNGAHGPAVLAAQRRARLLADVA
jgi:hypothetical protein